MLQEYTMLPMVCANRLDEQDARANGEQAKLCAK